MDVSIIIINYNTYTITKACIESVLTFTKNIDYEIILVDNASKEEEPVPFETVFPSISLLRMPENLGFAGGNNEGIKRAGGKYILLLNSDTYLQENSVAVTYDYLEKHPSVAVVSARLIFPDGRHQSVAQRFPSIKYTLLELIRAQKLLGPKRGGRLLLGSFFDHDSNAEADWVWGAYFMFPRHLLNKLSGNKLDDSYFMYAEDMQWCWDFKKLGYGIHYCAETTVVHIMGGSAAKKDDLILKSETLFFKKNFSAAYMFFLKPLKRIL